MAENRIVVRTQAELDALPDMFSTYTVIEIRSPETQWIAVAKARGSSHVEAWGSSHVVAWGSSHVVAWESSHVEAWGSSHVEAWGSSHVEAWGSSHVEAWESSHVVAWGSSHVEAWGSSHVEARESSHVVARESVAVHVHSDAVTATLYAFAVAWSIAKKAKIVRKSKTCRVVKPVRGKGTVGWLTDEALVAKSGHVVLYKRVSSSWKTREGTPNETVWEPGTTLTHPAWSPKDAECGAGKYHACSRTYFCDQFRSARGDRYVAIRIATKDLHAWPNGAYPHKVAFRKGTVLGEVDRYGQTVAGSASTSGKKASAPTTKAG